MSENDAILLAALSGQQNTISIKKPFIRWLGYSEAAVLTVLLEHDNNHGEPISLPIQWIADQSCLSYLDARDAIWSLCTRKILHGGGNFWDAVEEVEISGEVLDELLATFLLDEWAAGEGERR